MQQIAKKNAAGEIDKKVGLKIIKGGIKLTPQEQELLEKSEYFLGKDGRIYKDVLEEYRQFVFKKCGQWVW